MGKSPLSQPVAPGSMIGRCGPVKRDRSRGYLRDHCAAPTPGPQASRVGRIRRTGRLPDMADTNARLRAVWDMSVADVREYSGRHEYDGQIQDLSPEGVRVGLRSLAGAAAEGGRLDDDHDEAQMAVFERAAQVVFGDLELHRSNPYFHIGNMDLACYDREYAPPAERTSARVASE